MAARTKYASFPTAQPGTPEYAEQLAAYEAYNESNQGETERDHDSQSGADGQESSDGSEGDDEMENDRGFTYTAKFTLPGDETERPGKNRTFKVRRITGMDKAAAEKHGFNALMEAHPDAQLVAEKCNRPRGKGFAKGQDARRNTGGSGGGGGNQGEGSDEGDMRDSGSSSGKGKGQQQQSDEQQDAEGEAGGGESDDEQQDEREDTPEDLMLMRVAAEPLIGEAANERIAAIAANVAKDEVAAALKGFDPEAAEIDEAALAESITKAILPSLLKEMHGKTQRIKVDFNGETREVEGFAHKEFAEVMKAVRRQFNVFLYGPSGSGKGVLARMVAEALGLRFSFLSCSGGMSESQFLGRVIPVNDGLLYIQSEFIDYYENGGVFLIDEFDAINENVAMVLNEGLNAEHMAVPNRTEKPVATKAENFVCIVAGNTPGSGATMQFTGRNRLDIATLNRFDGSTFIVEYDERVETMIAESYLGKEGAAKLLKRFWAIRNKVNDLKLKRVWGTRNVTKIAIAMADGDSLDTCVKRHMISWTEDERRKVGVTS